MHPSVECMEEHYKVKSLAEAGARSVHPTRLTTTGFANSLGRRRSARLLPRFPSWVYVSGGFGVAAPDRLALRSGQDRAAECLWHARRFSWSATVQREWSWPARGAPVQVRRLREILLWRSCGSRGGDRRGAGDVAN